MWTWTLLERLWQDLRYAVRTLRHNPGFTAAAILSLALGIGANTAIFSLLRALVFRPLPVARPGELVQLTYTFPTTSPDNWNVFFDYPHLERFREQAHTVAGILATTGTGRMNLTFRGTSALAYGEVCTGGYFSVLGLAPQAGRLFASEDDRPGVALAVLSDSYWRNRFGADPSLIGGAITLNQIPFTVVGVAPRGFAGIRVGGDPDVWVPMRALDRLSPDPQRWTASFTSWLAIAARLRPGVTPAQAQAELDVLHRQLIAEQLPFSEMRGRESTQRFVRESRLVLRDAASGTYSGLREDYELPLKLLMGVAGMVLLVASANVASLLLARASNRRREIAVRLAIGAGRGRVVRQLLTESIVLAGAGGVLAMAMAWWGSTALVRMISTGPAPVLDVRLDWSIFAFTAAVSLATGIVFGLAPALRGTRVDPGPALKDGARQANRSAAAIDRLLVVGQVALSVVLITGAGLFVRTLYGLRGVNLGYDPGKVLMFSVDAKLAGYPAERRSGVYREILDRLRTLDDVRDAAATIVRPVDDQFDLIDLVNEIDGRQLPDRANIHVVWNSISPGYFSTMRTPILAGRDFDLRDTEGAAPVVIVNQAFAAAAFPGINPLGHKVAFATIIGVAQDSRYKGALDQARPELFHPLFQHGRDMESRWAFASFELRYRSGANLMDGVRREVAAVDRNLPVFRARTLEEQAAQSMLRERLLALLSSFFGGLALLLACLGLYGLMAFAVVRRTGEIGIRLALGARRDHILWLVLREILVLTGAGLAAGIPLALWSARYARSLLFGVGAADPLTVAGAAVLLIAIAAFAGYLPARRALGIDPMAALRSE